MGRRLVIEADGGSRGNPGPSGFGAVVRDEQTGEVLAELKDAIGVTTNNVAEYRGLIAGLHAAKDFDPEHVLVRMDSKLAIEQMAGRWKVKAAHIMPLFGEAQAAAKDLGVKVTYAHIPRELNKHADRLANEAMDAAGSTAPPVSARSAESGPRDTSRGPESSEGHLSPPKSWSDPVAASERTLPATQRLAGWNPAKDAPTTTLLLRHGESTLSIDRRFNGSSDPPLTELGLSQARAAADRLAATRKGAITAVVSSPLQRAYRTAEMAAQALDVPLYVDEGYRETDFGAWEGMTYSEVAKAYGDELKAWHGDYTIAPGGGESVRDTAARVTVARERTLEKFPGQQVLIVCHVTPIKVLLWQVLQASFEVLYRSALDLASLTEMDWYPDGGSVLKRFNDASHLEPR